ncbi:MAG: penicillin-binding protein, partial [Geodermatophilales bacterium]|nr:penicillin-binding protein [Geodermatophilales bacterium]
MAVPILGGCSGNAEDDVKAAAQGFLDDWSQGHPAAAAKASTDPAAATTLLEQAAKDLPDAKLSAKLGKVEVRNSSATVHWTATWDLAAAPDWSYPAALELNEGADGWQVVAEPLVVHPEL